MSKSVKTTRIEKKYQDKKTREWKSITIDYAKVVDRLNAFREDYPKSKIHTTHQSNDTGGVIFKAYIWKDKTEFMELLKSGVNTEEALLSADSDGTAEYAKEDEKKFEKLESIAVGRALALLGYAGTGEIASTEEMQEFEDYKADKKAEAITLAIEMMQDCKSLADLKQVFTSLGDLMKNPEIIKVKDEMKGKYEDSK